MYFYVKIWQRTVTRIILYVHMLRCDCMLRDYHYTENWRLLDHALEQFITLPDHLSLVGYAALSPDSFLWKIYDGATVYYLYAEDYVPSLRHVIAAIKEFSQEPIDLEFVPVKRQVAFEDSSPKQTSSVYMPPENEYDFMKYASPSGSDFVFLLKPDENISAR